MRRANEDFFTPGKYSVITFATNNSDYGRLALNCAQSVVLHNNLPVYIVSNLDLKIPDKFRGSIIKINAKPEDAILGIGMKLHIDEYIQTEHTLFIDSDCICFGSLRGIFDDCEGHDVTVAGNVKDVENWCGPAVAKTINDRFGLGEIIRFNGGLYYLRRSLTTTAIFNKAREIAESYDDYGFSRIKNKWMNEEVPLSIAMTLNKQTPIADDGSFMTDLYTDYRPAKLNVLNGTRLLKNKPYRHIRHRPWYPTAYAPVIVHFGGNNLKSYPYKSQSLILRLNRFNLPVWLSSLIVNIFVHVPYRSYHWIRDFISD